MLGLGFRVIWRLLQGFEFGRASMWVTVGAYEKTVALRVTAAEWELGLGVRLRFRVLGFGLGKRLLGSLMSRLVLQVPARWLQVALKRFGSVVEEPWLSCQSTAGT